MPRTAKDLDDLFAMLDAWRRGEFGRGPAAAPPVDTVAGESGRSLVAVITARVPTPTDNAPWLYSWHECDEGGDVHAAGRWGAWMGDYATGQPAGAGHAVNLAELEFETPADATMAVPEGTVVHLYWAPSRGRWEFYHITPPADDADYALGSASGKLSWRTVSDEGPSDVAAESAESAGTSADLSRADHAHALPLAQVGDPPSDDPLMWSSGRLTIRLGHGLGVGIVVNGAGVPGLGVDVAELAGDGLEMDATSGTFKIKCSNPLALVDGVLGLSLAANSGLEIAAGGLSLKLSAAFGINDSGELCPAGATYDLVDGSNTLHFVDGLLASVT